MTIEEKLMNIQVELKAPKGQYNSFGKYKYRSCEDILEAVKPLLKKYNCLLVVEDEIMAIGGRIYVKATACIYDVEQRGDKISNCAYAREEEEKKGMDGSQITGASSSYARKYALNGLLLIDDTKDSDATNTHGKDEPEKKATKEQIEKLKSFVTNENGEIDKVGMMAMLKYLDVERIEDTSEKLAAKTIAQKEKELKGGNNNG